MKTILFYYTGTGNSLWTARTLAKELEETEIISIPDFKGDISIVNGKILGIVFPVHMWGVPHAILKFVETLRGCKPDYFFAIAVNAGQVSNTLVQLKKVCLQQGLTLASGLNVVMPSNYTPWGGPGSFEKQTKRFDASKEKIVHFARQIQDRKTMPVEKGPLWQRVLLTLIYKMSFPHIYKMDRSFWVDEKCNSCTICKQVCPANNISMENGKPVWNHTCEQCLACLQWCPQKAIQFGKKTPKYERYHQPEVKLKDMIRRS